MQEVPDFIGSNTEIWVGPHLRATRPAIGVRIGDIEQELRPTKLKSAPPIEYGGDGRDVRYRKRAAR